MKICVIGIFHFLSLILLQSCGADKSSDVTKLQVSSGLISGGSIVVGPLFDGVVEIRAEDDLGRYKCTGSVIASNMILTAAHCIGDAQYFLKNHQVILKLRSGHTEKSVNLQASKVLIHPDYLVARNNSFDVAILKVEKIDFSKLVRIIPLATREEMKQVLKERKVTMVGLAPTSEKLLSFDVQLNEFNEYFLSISHSKNDVTHGDSGGPLYAKNLKNEYRQIGITSFSTLALDAQGVATKKIQESHFVRIERVEEMLQESQIIADFLGQLDFFIRKKNLKIENRSLLNKLEFAIDSIFINPDGETSFIPENSWFEIRSIQGSRWRIDLDVNASKTPILNSDCLHLPACVLKIPITVNDSSAIASISYRASSISSITVRPIQPYFFNSMNLNFE